jgi:hypothetical protein
MMMMIVVVKMKDLSVSARKYSLNDSVGYDEVLHAISQTLGT